MDCFYSIFQVFRPQLRRGVGSGVVQLLEKRRNLLEIFTTHTKRARACRTLFAIAFDVCNQIGDRSLLY
ncbi:hypothetical protein [Nostoc sp.]|uniref:hypothetical protein n=1 Tax=Nostoc sp. TaxID=1180 RepID=UPI002FF6600F